MHDSGIYLIVNSLTGDSYVGSSVNLFKRKKEHFRQLKLNKHHSYILQSAYNKYGIDNLKFEVIFNCYPGDCIEFENYFFTIFSTKYNISKDATAPMLGRKHRADTIEKFKNRKVKTGEEHYLYGTKWSDEVREKIIKKRMGSKRNSETKLKMSETAKRINSINRIDREKSKRAIIDNDNVIYSSLSEAASLNCISTQTVCDILKGRHSKTRKGKSFKYYES